MANYSDEERAAILAESFALLERRPDETFTRETDYESPSREELLREALAQPLETRNQRDAREIAEQDARWAAERRQREADVRTTAVSSTMDPDTQAKWDAWLTAHITNSRNEHNEVIGDVLGELLRDVRDELRAEFNLKLDALRAEFAKQRAIDAREIIDLPALPRRATQ